MTRTRPVAKRSDLFVLHGFHRFLGEGAVMTNEIASVVRRGWSFPLDAMPVAEMNKVNGLTHMYINVDGQNSRFLTLQFYLLRKKKNDFFMTSKSLQR